MQKGLALLLLAFACAACSASGDGQTDAGLVATPVGACVPNALSQGNEHHVGAYCTPGGNQCSAYLEIPGAAKFCASDLDQEGGNFCLKVGCHDHDTCGEKACCTGRVDNPTKACVPAECVTADGVCPPIPGLSDAGTGDAGPTDAAGSDA